MEFYGHYFKKLRGTNNVLTWRNTAHSKPSHLLPRLEEIYAEICASAWLLQSGHLCTACKPDPISLGPHRTLHGLWICLIKFQISAWMQHWLLRLYLDSLALKRDSFNWNRDACYLSKQIHNMSPAEGHGCAVDVTVLVDRQCLNIAGCGTQRLYNCSRSLRLLSFYHIHLISLSVPDTSQGSWISRSVVLEPQIMFSDLSCVVVFFAIFWQLSLWVLLIGV